MKKILLLSIAFMLCGLTIKAQWNQSLTGQSSLISGLSVVNNDVVWAKDQLNSKFSISTDGGQSWITKNLPLSMVGKVGSFSAVSATTAFVVMSMASGTYTQGVYKTTDGGDTWTRQTSAFLSPSSFPDLVYFWNENDGVAVGDGVDSAVGNLDIYTTSNGGNQWNQVTALNMPTGAFDWTLNSNSLLRVLGNSFYFFSGLGKIYKSADKGLSWTTINTPLTNANNARFDFKDDNNGLLSDYNSTNGIYSLYSTSNGGLNWSKIDSISKVSEIKYIPSLNAYFSTNSNLGLSYSTDNGATWTIHPSFVNVGLRPVGYAPSGKVFVGGWSYLYNTNNYTGVNLAVNKVVITGSKNLDITFSNEVDITSAQDTANYLLNHREIKDASKNWIYNKIVLSSATVDNINKSVVHLVATSDFPIDTLYSKVLNVKGLNAYPSISKNYTNIHTSLTNYSNVKLALIGSSYFLNNVLDGTKANWNVCWKDPANNIQASIPVVSVNGMINTWSFPNVILDGANQGMFKFCIPNEDNTPDWTKKNYGSDVISNYTGTAAADVDRVTDGAGGALIILTSGLKKRYDIKLIIDQTNWSDIITLNIEYNNSTSIQNNAESSLIVGYSIYTTIGTLVATGESVQGLQLKDIKENLAKGVYLIKAKLSNGEIRKYKVLMQ